MSKRQSKSTRKPAKPAPALRKSKERPIPPVEKAWLKFVYEFHAFKETPDDESDKKIHKAWEKALFATDKAACAVMAAPATCLRDIAFKIRAWAFTAEVKTVDDIGGLADWQPGDDLDSKFIASLRDDIQIIRRLVQAANLAVASIERWDAVV